MARTILTALLLVGVSGIARAGDGADTVVATVGETSLSKADLASKVGIEKAYGNTGVTEEAALVGLINDAIEHEVASLNGIAVSQEEMASFNRHVDETTKAPEILGEVKRLFGNNKDSYERIYLRPRIINRKLHGFYNRNSEIPRKERALIEKAYGLVHSGKTCEEAARELGVKASTFELEDKEREVDETLRKYLPHTEGTLKDPLIAILQGLSEGELYRYIVEGDGEYRVIRLAGKRDRVFSVEAVTVFKRPFGEWFREQAARIRIAVSDPYLLEKVRKEFNDVWWVSTVAEQGTGKVNQQEK